MARQLLLFKVWAAVLSAVLTGLFFTVFFRQYAALTLAAQPAQAQHEGALPGQRGVAARAAAERLVRAVAVVAHRARPRRAGEPERGVAPQARR